MTEPTGTTLVLPDSVVIAVITAFVLGFFNTVVAFFGKDAVTRATERIRDLAKEQSELTRAVRELHTATTAQHNQTLQQILQELIARREREPPS